MKNWIEHIFSDADHALAALVWVAGIAGTLGFAMVMAAVLLSR
jgi:hypothetical protein